MVTSDIPIFRAFYTTFYATDAPPEWSRDVAHSTAELQGLKQ